MANVTPSLGRDEEMASAAFSDALEALYDVGVKLAPVTFLGAIAVGLAPAPQ